jgi:hypothetical protein
LVIVTVKHGQLGAIAHIERIQLVAATVKRGKRSVLGDVEIADFVVLAIKRSQRGAIANVEQCDFFGVAIEFCDVASDGDSVGFEFVIISAKLGTADGVTSVGDDVKID